MFNHICVHKKNPQMEALQNTSVAFADELKYLHPKNMASAPPPPPFYTQDPLPGQFIAFTL